MPGREGGEKLMSPGVRYSARILIKRAFLVLKEWVAGVRVVHISLAYTFVHINLSTWYRLMTKKYFVDKKNNIAIFAVTISTAVLLGWAGTIHMPPSHFSTSGTW